MKNPNAFAALLAAAISVGVQWLVQRYAHVALSDYWKNAVTGGTIVAVLYVGSNGLKAAVWRLWHGPKTVWSGTAPPPAK